MPARQFPYTDYTKHADLLEERERRQPWLIKTRERERNYSPATSATDDKNNTSSEINNNDNNYNIIIITPTEMNNNDNYNKIIIM